jgi:phosphoglycolate phosphatase-like HAD superfamily hydrolase
VTIRCVVFDFDGTLVDSNKIKSEAFFAVTGGEVGEVALLKEILAAPKPGTRYEIFGELARRIHGDGTLALQRSKSWAEAYSAHCEEAIVTAREIEGAEDCLNALHRAGLDLYINSATPEADLGRVVARRELSKFFNGVYGTPATKAENLARAMADACCTKDEMVLVGDGALDREGAAAFGCGYVAIGEGGLGDLRHLPGRLAAMGG